MLSLDTAIIESRISTANGNSADGITAQPAEVAAEKDEGEIALQAARDATPGTYGNVQVIARGALAPAWRSVKISSGGGEGETFATVNQATLAVIEKTEFRLDAEAETVNLVRGASTEFQVAVARAEDFSAPIRFSLEHLPPGVTASEAVAAPEATSVTIRLTARKDAAPGRFSRVAILGRAGSGQVQQAPHITIVLD